MPEYMTLRNGRRVVLNTEEEEAAVNAGIAADEDTHEVTEAGFEAIREDLAWSLEHFLTDEKRADFVRSMLDTE